MEILIICLTAISASFLTFFSGFGLGTILMPVFLFFFPLDTAIALTAVVHLLNNILKMILLFKYVAWHVVLRFGIPAFIAAFLGAQLLFFLEKIPALYSYSLNGKIAMITPVKLTLSFLMFL
ncbi:MAG TPA: TSUP family transporter, partial [Candidatus Omnitrophota bacterium]|nr:TSUP family transporter [Candidatus Omnitrophota bacterium]